MALNPFARRRADGEVGPADSASPTPASGQSAGADDPGSGKPSTTRTRRGTRGGRRTRTTTSRSAADASETKASRQEPEAPAKATKPSPRRTSRSRAKPAVAGSETEDSKAEAPAPKSPPRARRGSSAAKTSEPDFAALAKAIEQQARELGALRKAMADQAAQSEAEATATSEQRIGIFVDAANAEKAREERRTSLDWKLLLKRLAAGRRITRAVAYAPISDDPGVSIETQRFVEPFLDAGYRVVTKPLKRFQGGAIKANLDIEIALDIMQMLERLDVVCLVSGDGDFEPLVEAAQRRGVRVEVASFPHNTAAKLRQAADEFIDLSRIQS